MGSNFFSGVHFFKANEVEAAEDVNVNAFIESDVSEINSTVATNVNEVLADSSQSVIITVTLKDGDGNPLPNLRVKIVSNRGEIDQIEAVEFRDGEFHVLTEGVEYLSLAGIITEADENGVIMFRVSSSVPGEATFLITADTVVEFDPINITFLPLPFPKKVTVILEVPSLFTPDKEITIFNPGEESDISNIDREKLVNAGMKIKIPFSVFLAITVVVLLNVILFLVIVLLLRRIKKIEKIEEKKIDKEEKLLEKIAEKEGIDTEPSGDEDK